MAYLLLSLFNGKYLDVDGCGSSIGTSMELLKPEVSLDDKLELEQPA